MFSSFSKWPSIFLQQFFPSGEKPSLGPQLHLLVFFNLTQFFRILYFMTSTFLNTGFFEWTMYGKFRLFAARVFHNWCGVLRVPHLEARGVHLLLSSDVDFDHPVEGSTDFCILFFPHPIGNMGETFYVHTDMLLLISKYLPRPLEWASIDHSLWWLQNDVVSLHIDLPLSSFISLPIYYWCELIDSQFPPVAYNSFLLLKLFWCSNCLNQQWEPLQAGSYVSVICQTISFEHFLTLWHNSMLRLILGLLLQHFPKELWCLWVENGVRN